MNAAKITTATIFPSAIACTGLEGNNPLRVSTIEVISLISVLEVIITSPTPKLNKFPTTNPTIAARAVVPNKTVNDLDVSFPKFTPSFILIITLIIDTKIKGTTSIFKRSINPLPTNPYHLLTSSIHLIDDGSFGNPATN